MGSGDYSKTEAKLRALAAQREADLHRDCSTPGCRLEDGHCGLHRFVPEVERLRAALAASERERDAERLAKEAQLVIVESLRARASAAEASLAEWEERARRVEGHANTQLRRAERAEASLAAMRGALGALVAGVDRAMKRLGVDASHEDCRATPCPLCAARALASPPPQPGDERGPARCEKPPAVCEGFVGTGPCSLCAGRASSPGEGTP